MARIFETPHQLLEAIGEPLGHSSWLEVDQSRIDLFAEATDDRQWIHVDPERAKDGPFGTTIAHGYLTLSLVNRFLPEIIEVQGISMGVNYGCEKIRFPAAVTVGSRLRGSGVLVAAENIKGAVQAIVRVTVEIQGSDRPACVVDTISRFVPVK